MILAHTGVILAQMEVVLAHVGLFQSITYLAAFNQANDFYCLQVMTYKIIHKLCPNSFLEKYKPKSPISKHRTERYEKSFHYSALKEWNNTPRDTRELPTTNTFKRQLKLYMKSKT